MIFSILTPTRNRPDKVQRFITSIKRTTKQHGRVELFFYVDNDDQKPDMLESSHVSKLGLQIMQEII